MLQLIAMNLAAGPWRLKTFEDPEPAIRAFQEEDPRPSLLLTDYSMRSMNGLELGQRLKSINPSLKVVLMSGTTAADILESSEFAADAFVSKPFASRTLMDVMRSLLQG